MVYFCIKYKAGEQMILLNKVRVCLENQHVNTIAQALGYNSIQKYQKKVQQFMQAKSLASWLRTPTYDFVHSSESFLIQLCTILNINTKECLSAINKAKTHNQMFACLQSGIMFVHTDFVRTTQPIHILAACESQRRIAFTLADEFVTRSLYEKRAFFSKMIKKHYQLHNGILPLWGIIKCYSLYFDKKSYRFNTNGEYIKHIANKPATVSYMSVN